ncbi:MAG: metallophosphoesterase [Myxococcales bacterium]
MRYPEGRKLRTIEHRDGPVLVSTDLHGNLDDFHRLRAIFESAPRCLWVSVGDWVHGPADEERRDVTSDDGEPLYDYDDRSPELLEELFDLMDGGRVVSLPGNHEHAHVGGKRTRKFHDDEAAFLESRLPAARVEELRKRFLSWPLFVRLPSQGVLVTHGAPMAELDGPDDVERVRYQGPNDARSARLLESALTNYGFLRDHDRMLLQKLGGEMIVHGHDRSEQGFEPSAEAALLLCSSFGAKKSRKAFLWLEPGRTWRLGDLREGREIRFLYG